MHMFGELEVKHALMLIILFSLTVRFGVSSGSYSGESTPPMYGDYEAQRHWMEITTNLPIQDWYQNTTDNDLRYWGLDYPPLTAYHSYLCGLCGRWVDPNFMELFTSRGYQSATSKLFMRCTAIASELFIFTPAALLFFMSKSTLLPAATQARSRLSGVWVALLNPALILVDHGHFQYNAVSLGFTLAAVALILHDRIYLGSCMYCLALCFKQISLYYAPAFFFFLLSQALRRPSWSAAVGRVACLGLVVVLTMLLCFLPWVLQSWTEQSPVPVLQLFARMFPFTRGLYEDKVANFWCVSGLVFKWKRRLALPSILFMCTTVTVLGSLPSGLLLLRRPTPRGFLYALATTSLSFFLFSFQVHEKSILFPLLPITCLALHHPLLARWAALLAAFSMYPLLHKDGQDVPYIALQLFFAWTTAFLWPPGAASAEASRLPRRAFHLSLAGMVGVHLAAMGCVWIKGSEHVFPLLRPIKNMLSRYPDVDLYLFAGYSMLHFLGMYLYLLLQHARANCAKPQAAPGVNKEGKAD